MILKITIVLFVFHTTCAQSSASTDIRSTQNFNWPPPPLDNSWSPSPRRRRSLQEQNFGIDDPQGSNKQWNSASYAELLRVPRDHDSNRPPSDQYDRPPPQPPPDHYGRPPPHGGFHTPPHNGYDRPPPPYNHFNRPPPPPPPPPPPRPGQYYEQQSPLHHYVRPSPYFDTYDRPPPPPPNRINDWYSPPPNHSDTPPLLDKNFSSKQNLPIDYKPQNEYFPSRIGETSQSSSKEINYNKEDLIHIIESLFKNQNVVSNAESNLNQTPPSSRVPKDTENINEIESQLNKDPKTVQSTQNPYVFDVRNGFGLENMSPPSPNANLKIANDPISPQSSLIVNKPFLIPLFQATPVTPKSS